MSLNDEVEHLRSLPLFARIAPAKLKLLAFTSQRLRFSPGQALFHQGDVGDAAYLLLEGTADVYVSAGAREIHLSSIDAVSIVGEIAILCDVPRTATVIARSELDTLQILKDRFWWLIAEFPEVGVELMRVLAKRLADRTAELAEARAGR
jgi:CRP-like cAMP-binding protein